MPPLDTLGVLLFIYALILLINAVLSGVLWYYSREQFYGVTLQLWLVSFANFFLQGVFRQLDLAMVLTFATYFPCSLLLVRLLELSTERTYPKKLYLFLMGTCLVATLVSAALKLNFTVMALFPAIGIAFPMLHSSFMTIRDRGLANNRMVRVLNVLMVLNALHFLDYPFLRTHDSNALAGFSVALIFLFCFSIFLPSFSIANIASRYSHQLEGLVLARTQTLVERNRELALTNGKLDTSNNELKNLTEEHDHLLRLVVHDVASPLSILSHHVDSISSAHAMGEKTPEITYSKMKVAVSSIKEVLTNVKKLHSLRTGKFTLVLEPVNVLDALKDLMAMFESQLESKKLRMSLIDNTRLGSTVLAEYHSIRNHVLNNILSNAIKYSEPGSDIEIMLEDEGSMLRVTVADHGIGIPKNLINNVFDISKPTTRPGTLGEKGTGFGMPIVKRYLDRYGATVTIESQTAIESPEDHGTEFHIYFKKAS